MNQITISIEDMSKIYSSNFSTFKEEFLKNIFKFKNHDQLYSYFIYIFNKELLNEILPSLWKKSYLIFFNQFPHYKNNLQKYNFIYTPSSNIIESKYLYYHGTDRYIYGWNLVGKTIESIYYTENNIDPIKIYTLYYLGDVLEHQYINIGQDITHLEGFTIDQILNILELKNEIQREMNKEELDRINNKFISKTLSLQNEIEKELLYPNSFISLIRMKYASFLNINRENYKKILIQHKFINPLCEHLDKENPSNIPETMWIKLFTLLENKKIPLEENIDIHFWHDWKAFKFLPYLNSSLNIDIIYINENNEPISPLYNHEIKYNKKIYPSIQHLMYQLLFSHFSIDFDFSLINQNIFNETDVDSLFESFIYQKIIENIKLCISQSINDDTIIYYKLQNIYSLLIQTPFNINIDLKNTKENDFEKWIIPYNKCIKIEKINKLRKIWNDLNSQMKSLYNIFGENIDELKILSFMKIIYPWNYSKCKSKDYKIIYKPSKENIPKWYKINYKFFCKFFSYYLLDDENSNIIYYHEKIKTDIEYCGRIIIYLYHFTDNKLEEILPSLSSPIHFDIYTINWNEYNITDFNNIQYINNIISKYFYLDH